MNTFRLTISANGDVGEKDYRGLQGQMTVNVPAGETRSFDLTGTQWNDFRSVMVKLSQKRIPIVVSGVRTGKTKPLLTYSVALRPGGKPRVHQIEGSIGVGGPDAASQSLDVYGENLIPGVYALAYVKKNTSSQIALSAARKGPVGNRVSVKFLAASGAGAISVTPDNLGGAAIEVTPAALGPDANSIAAQMTAHAECSRYVTAVGGGAGTVGAVGPVTLDGGDGSGLAFLDVRTATTSAYLRVEARKPGNAGNGISLVLAAAGVASVVVAGRKITVTPGLGATTLDDVAAQLAANSDASALVAATVIGLGATAMVLPLAESFLYGGSADEPSATVGGAAAVITSFSDTQISMTVAKSALISAGVGGGDACTLLIQHDTGVLVAGHLSTAGRGVYKDSVRLATAAALAAYTRVGNVITANANGALGNIDGVAPAAGNRVLLKNGAAGEDNGIYEVTQLGGVGTPFIFTRAGDMNTSAEVIANMVVPVREGTLFADRSFQLTSNGPFTLNTTTLTFSLNENVGAHAATHVTGGGDTIPDAVAAGNSGLLSGADKTKLDALTVADLVVRDGSIAFTGPVRHAVYANIAALPAAPPDGRTAYLTSGRKTGEGGGLGTGIMTYSSGGAWLRYYDDAAVTE